MNNRIKQIRQYLNLTQSEFAEELGLSKNYISLIENGQRSLGDQSIKVLCSKHSVNEEWIREGTGSMLRKQSQQEELAMWVKSLSDKGATSSQIRIAKILTRLSPDDWIAIDHMIDQIKNIE